MGNRPPLATKVYMSASKQYSTGHMTEATIVSAIKRLETILSSQSLGIVGIRTHFLSRLLTIPLGFYAADRSPQD